MILLPTVSKFTGHKFACWWLYLVAFNHFLPKVQLKHCSVNCLILHGLISITMWLNGYLSRFVLPTSLWGQCICLIMADMYQKTMACSDSLLYDCTMKCWMQKVNVAALQQSTEVHACVTTGNDMMVIEFRPATCNFSCTIISQKYAHGR